MTLLRDGRLHGGTYVFDEHYCADPACDCRRVLLLVFSVEERRPVATINHAFDPPGPGSLEAEQTFLDPLDPQSSLSEAVLEEFLGTALDGRYAARLERHYARVKDLVRGGWRPAPGRPRGGRREKRRR